MPFLRNGDRVVIDISEDDYGSLMILLGYATGAIGKDKSDAMRLKTSLDLVDRINDGNDRYIPYNYPDLLLSEESANADPR